MYNYWGHGLGLGYGFGWIFTIIFWALVIWLVVALIRGWRPGKGCCGMGHDQGGHDGHKEGGAGKKSAQDILDERYAKGEIKKEEYEQKKKDLKS